MKKLIALSCLLAVSCAPAAVAPPAPSFDKASMDNLLSSAVSSGDFIGASALIFDEGHTVYKGTFGLSDRERERPTELDTVFRIYSMTKPITSAIIMDLQEDGLLKLSDPVSKYIPELGNMKVASQGENGEIVMSEQAQPMTIEDLLLHRAGLGYGIFGPVNPAEALYEKANLFSPGEDLSVKMGKLSQLPLIAQPGDGWYYSYGIDVLGRIAEVVTDKNLSEIMNERIFTPLGMTDTGFYVRPDQKDRFASNYVKTKEGTYALQDDGQKSPYLNKPAFESGGGGLVSTLGDYAKFAQMLLDGGTYEGHQVLKPETVKMMMSDQMDADDKFLMPWLGEKGIAGFGYGGRVNVADTPDLESVNGNMAGQFGWGGMARTTFWVDPKNDAFGILMLQYFGQKDPKLHDDFRALALSQTKDAK